MRCHYTLAGIGLKLGDELKHEVAWCLGGMVLRRCSVDEGIRCLHLFLNRMHLRGMYIYISLTLNYGYVEYLVVVLRLRYLTLR